MTVSAGNPLIAFVVWALCATGAGANPTGATVVNGQVTIAPSGNLLQITNSPNSIINWQTFSIGPNEITRFVQQSGASAVLNRVVGTGGTIDPSVILGALQSNGRVFLINPSGIVFGAGAQIDVAGLVASSLNLSNADFLAGRLRFTETPAAGAVVNQGAINAAAGGQVYLAGPSVTNGGVITAPQGEVILAAGNAVELVNPGTPNLRVEITAPDNEALNLGQIIASSGRIGIYAGLMRSSGALTADGAAIGPGGQIFLKATKSAVLSGTITAGNLVTIEAGQNIDVLSGTDIQSGPVVAPNLGDIHLLVGNGTSGSITLIAGNNIQPGAVTPGAVTVNNVSFPLAVNPSGSGNAGVPPALLPGAGLSLVPLILPLAPSVQAIDRNLMQITQGVSTISQVNDFTRSVGGASPYTLAPPRTSLVYE